MTEKPATTSKQQKAKRPDDRRGTPKGKATMEGPGSPKGGGRGRIGNPPFVATDQQRALVRNYAKCFPLHSQHLIAKLIGVSRDTLRTHFAEELELGRAELIAAAGTQVINMALKGRDAVDDKGKPLTPGDLDALKFLLARQGGWTTKVEMTGRGGGPIQHADLSRLSQEQLAEYGRLAALAEGLDPDEVVGGSED